MWDRLSAKNTNNMHLGNKQRSKQQQRESKKAKAIPAGLRDHGATKAEICVAVSNAVGVSSSQLSDYVDGQLQNNMGELFCSQAGLNLASDYVLSLSQDEDDKTDSSK